jgi:hypothetical protein
MLEPEDSLSEAVLATAVRAGKELAWRRDDVIPTLTAARDAGLACLGGQVQFRCPGGTYELYWLNFDPAEDDDISWAARVTRTFRECASAFERLVETTNFEEEARRAFPSLNERIGSGVDLEQYLVFPCYFQVEP